MPDKLSDERRTTYHALGVTNGSLQIEKRVWARCDTGFGGGWWGYKRRESLMTTDEIEEFPRSALGTYVDYRKSLEGQLIEAQWVVTKLKANIAAAEEADDRGDAWVEVTGDQA